MKNVLVIARFELLRLLGSRSAWWPLIAFCLVWSILLYYVIGKASVYLRDEEYSRLIGGLTGNAGVQNLLAWPVPELSVFWGLALYLFPLFCIVIASDQTASDRSRGTLRLLNLRATRDEIFFGRFLGHVFIQLLLVIATVATVLFLALGRNSSVLSDGVALSILLSANLLIALLPFIALMAVTSAVAKSSRLSIALAVVVWFVLFFSIKWLTSSFPHIVQAEWILPGAQLSDLLKKEGWDMLSHAPLPMLQTAFLLLLGRWIMIRGDL